MGVSTGGYGGDLTGGSLLVRESRIVARLLVKPYTPDKVKAIILEDNLFQNHSASTTRRYSNLILLRVQKLTTTQLHLIADGTDETTRLMLFAAVLKAHKLVLDFVREVLFDKVRCYEPSLSKMDWTRFIEQRETIDTEVGKWTDSSRKKIGQVIIRILSEAGFLSDTRSMTIQFPCIPFDVADSLQDSPDGYILDCLKLGKVA